MIYIPECTSVRSALLTITGYVQMDNTFIQSRTG
uniref:Uncharacterized protein n=1 Tax=Anguilla anguilla TaxID=7936 RepID=A0A0E9U8X0_ANGAN